MGQVDPEFAAYVRGRQAHLLRIAVLMCGDVQQAEDLLQEALIKLARRWDAVGRERPDAYVRRILYNDNISRWRRTRLEVVTEQPPEPPGVRYGPMWEARADVRAALQELAPRQRAVLVLRFLEDLTQAQTAEVLGISDGTVKSQTHDALARMRDLLGPVWDPARADEAERVERGAGR
jgi:RNA polymerase sigma-70 factor (sigma-E family)